MLDKYSNDVLERAKKIKLLILDVDGVFTDGKIIYGSYGNELKNFDVNDGLGVYLLRRSGVKCIILTAKASPIVTRRAKGLNFDKVYHNYHYKIEALGKILKKFKVKTDEMCFVGDELIDIPILKRVGLAICPPNAMDDVKPFAHFITEKTGGRGAVREVCDMLMKVQGTWDSVTAVYFK